MKNKTKGWIPDPASLVGFATAGKSLILKKAGLEWYWINSGQLSEGVQFLTRSELLGMTA
jgi:hypothetical protein